MAIREIWLMTFMLKMTLVFLFVFVHTVHTVRTYFFFFKLFISF